MPEYLEIENPVQKKPRTKNSKMDTPKIRREKKQKSKSKRKMAKQSRKANR